MFLEEEKEPTEHILNEMMEQEEAFAGYAEQIIFVVRSKDCLLYTSVQTLQSLTGVPCFPQDVTI